MSVVAEAASSHLHLVAAAVVVPIVLWVGLIVHRLYLHPLKHIPGPKLNAISRLPYAYHVKRGTTVHNVAALHAKYGSVVRVTPNELSFSDGETAWPEIYGLRTGKLKGHQNMRKDPVWYSPSVSGAKSLLVTDDEGHSRMRRILAHAFSDRALKEQEDLIQKYVDQLLQGLTDVARSGKSTDVVAWYNWTTFDVIADLLYGEPFGCLQNRTTHKYVELLFANVMGFGNLYMSTYFPLLKKFFINDKSVSARYEFYDWVDEQTKKRMARETARPDFMQKIMDHNTEKDGSSTISHAEIIANGIFLLVAGSETTATLLSGVSYHLMRNPRVYHKLKEEIRSTFKSYEEMTLEAVNETPYLIAVLQEALRIFPPLPTGFPRRTPPGGETVSGVHIPENTGVYVSSWAVGHDEKNFKNCEEFVPERWQGDEAYANDKRHAMQPFSFGPRNCLGRNLAVSEMRLILAKMMWSFDWELEPAGKGWIDGCRVFTLMQKPELPIKFSLVERD